MYLLATTHTYAAAVLLLFLQASGAATITADALLTVDRPDFQPTAMQTMYVTHGGGPMPLLGDRNHAALTKFLKSASSLLGPSKPKAILSVTAHWEENVPTVSTSDHPSMLYDYGGFPEEAYQFKYPAPGSPEVAKRVRELLHVAGIPSAEDAKRGFDHGTFVPLMLMFPDADIPVVQLSLMRDMNPRKHLEMGRALAPLRQEGVLILASGSSFHNMGVFMQAMRGTPYDGPAMQAAQGFDNWLQHTVTQLSGKERDSALEQWAQAPGGKVSHPREEHLIPLMVVAGAAGEEPGHAVFQGNMLGIPVSSFMFGSRGQGAQQEL